MQNGKKKHFFLILLVLLIPTVSAFGQCAISASKLKICKGNSIDFSTLSTAFKYEWKSGSGQTETHQKATFLFDKRGTFKVSLVLYDSLLHIKCRDSIYVTIFDLPVADLNISDSVYLCKDGVYCFSNISKPGLDKSPISQYLWLFGDGDMSYLKNPCHKYSRIGDYMLYLNVRDSNGCEAVFQKKHTVLMAPPIIPWFRIDTTTSDSCPVSRVKFINLTPTPKNQIRNFYWKFGDGSGDTNKLWTNFYHTYTKNGLFHAKLYLESIYGCRDSFTCDTCPINNVINFTFDIVKYSDNVCYEGNNIVLRQVFRPNIDQLKWDFGEGGTAFNTGESWLTSHSYSKPGIYNIHLHVDASKCSWDTTLCQYVRILGPKAEIFPDNQINDTTPIKRMPLDSFLFTASKCMNPLMNPLNYEKLVKVSPYIKDSIKTYCNAKIDKVTYIKTACGTDSVVKLKPTGVKYIYDSFIVSRYTFYPWDPIPTGMFYSLPTGKNYSYSMHDTDLFSCILPNYVMFTNTSKKFRLYTAIDDNPPYKDGSSGSDMCKNKSYPWASDSLLYFWDFADKTAPSCTSTVAKRNMKCRYSTEKLPWHIYSNEGCYKVILEVRDTITKCSSWDTVLITNSHPDAGWDTNRYHYLDYIIQKIKPAVAPRRGMSLGGMECVFENQKVNLNEILPQCPPEDWAIVFDSLNDCSYCTDTIYQDTNSDGQLDSIFHKFFKCNWVTKTIYNYYYPYGYPYSIPGCKSVGLRVKNGDCYDEFWYHNYKFINKDDASFSMIGSGFCNLKDFSLTPFVKKQDGIVSFRFDVRLNNAIIFSDSCRNIADTAYKLCQSNAFSIDSFGKKTYYYCFNYPTYTCPDEPLDQIPLDTLLKKYTIVDTFYTLALTDTIHIKNAGNKKGIYSISSTLQDIHGCIFTDEINQGIGFNAFFWADNIIFCANSPIQFYDSEYYYAGNYLPFKTDWDFNNDGTYEKTAVHNPTYSFPKPGTYTIKLRVIDLRCNDTIYITKQNYIHITGVKAAFDTLNSPYNCAPQVVKFLDSSMVLNSYKYRYDSLGNVYDSFLADAICCWQWDFGDHKGQYSQSYKKNPAHPYTSNGFFNVSLLVTTYLGCVDSVKINDYIKIEGPRPGFKLLDTAGCVPYGVRVIDSSEEMSGWIWNPGNKSQLSGLYKKGDTVSFIYNNPGVYYISLTGTDTVYNYFLHTYHKCISTFPDSGVVNPFKVTVYPTDNLNFTGDTIICSGSTAIFKDHSDPDFDTIFWNFGDGDSTLTAVYGTPGHIYYLNGDTLLKKFTVYHDGKGARCPGSPGRLNVTVKKVIAGLVWDSASSDGPYFCFRNLSEGGTQYIWDFGSGNPRILNVKDYNNHCTNFYADKGIKTICLTAKNEIGCVDKACVDIENKYDIFIYVPNVFTPENHDGLNDEFIVTSLNIENYDLKIFNRWGQMVFRSNDANKHWDGIDMETGKSSSAGTYYYILTYNFKYLKTQVQSGTCTLIR